MVINGAVENTRAPPPNSVFVCFFGFIMFSVVFKCFLMFSLFSNVCSNDYLCFLEFCCVSKVFFCLQVFFCVFLCFVCFPCFLMFSYDCLWLYSERTMMYSILPCITWLSLMGCASLCFIYTLHSFIVSVVLRLCLLVFRFGLSVAKH